ncbi:synaptic vesicle glycoprotein 2C [Bombyx mori]|uniref:Major facilitator superfamily (MFS) profile domain-containing protein n=1 Tax=Bombyx mori TaxID=7091 RepID=A0A8R2M3M0_BOMMO|nr:synaptic vesicle glycoprotein 2C [Bombyx mori]XP_037872567.1 synaptic vesicle glycoprotein 2C [Bombyx mori]XP_037872568.1 synaptic vesicle glycoprotein 2C [Bombyx mori]XP_037872569.1 synaptic vesicle glycoprotein 2C [Bombyx mori]XP_037872573.1 synaptic vesicle glycoprotein 2C [Bombyx mori]
MEEEQAWLVRTRSDSETSSKLSFGSLSRTMTYTEHRLSAGAEAAGEPGNTITMASSPPDNATEGNESGELLDYNDSSILEQFHEDALRQTGCGLSQVRIVLSVGLAVAGATLELAAIPFILPSAEIELCILLHEKNWLVMITLVGWAFGALGWGALAERLGRRRTLLSCLAVNAVFAAIAAFMPTYGTFMMARLCSAIGSGGVVPCGAAYVWEWCGAGVRRAALAGAAGAGAAGLFAAAALAAALLPPTGALTLIENKEHFSAWHRYLLFCTLPILASLVSLIWTPESARYLLEVGREVDAMVVYQSVHNGNRCGRGGAGRDAEPALPLPAKRRPPALHHVRHSLKMFWQSFFQLFSGAHRRTTVSLGGTLLFAMAIQFYLSSYVPSTVGSIESERFEASRVVVRNETLVARHYRGTVQNVHYANVSFVDCTFRDVLLSHVRFRNCSFTNVSLLNIKSSHTHFEGCLFVNSSIIDTDLELGGELDAWCRVVGTAVRGPRGGCARHASLTSRLAAPLARARAAAPAVLLAALLALLPRRLTRTVTSTAACVLLSPLLYIATSETALYTVEAVYTVLITLVFLNVTGDVLESYPAGARCTAHGVILSAAYSSGAVLLGAGDAGAALSCVLCAALALAATAFAYNR